MYIFVDIQVEKPPLERKDMMGLQTIQNEMVDLRAKIPMNDNYSFRKLAKALFETEKKVDQLIDRHEHNKEICQELRAIKS